MLIVQYIEIPDHGFTCEIEQITSLAGARLVLPVVEYEFHPYIYIYICTYIGGWQSTSPGIEAVKAQCCCLCCTTTGRARFLRPGRGQSQLLELKERKFCSLI